MKNRYITNNVLFVSADEFENTKPINYNIKQYNFSDIYIKMIINFVFNKMSFVFDTYTYNTYC